MKKILNKLVQVEDFTRHENDMAGLPGDITRN